MSKQTYTQEDREKNRDEWICNIQDWQNSNLSGAAWCRNQGVPYSQFLYWRKFLSNNQMEAQESFIEITDSSPSDWYIHIVNEELVFVLACVPGHVHVT